MSMLKLYTNPRSRGRIVRWMLEEIGQPYETAVLEYGAAMQQPAYLALNPMGKVPTLVHGEQVVTEVPAILCHLADAFPAAGLALEPAQRADYYRWLFFAAGPLEAAVTDRGLGIEAVPPEKQGFVGYGSFDRVVDVLARMLDGRRFIAGDRFSAADLYLASALNFGLLFKTLPERPAFKAYVEPHIARPAFARAAALDDGPASG